MDLIHVETKFEKYYTKRLKQLERDLEKYRVIRHRQIETECEIYRQQLRKTIAKSVKRTFDSFRDQILHDKLILLAHETAAKYNAVCLSEECLCLKDPLWWKCQRGHVFQRSFSKIKNKSTAFCLECTQRHPSESICRLVLECLFKGYDFPSSKPEWLINPETGSVMELDCYNAELGLALEYNGPHHTELKYNDMDQDKFEKQLQRDKIKHVLCRQHSVSIIVVDYKFDRTKFKHRIFYECLFLYLQGYLKIKPNTLDRNRYLKGLRQIRTMMVNFSEFNNLWQAEKLEPDKRELL